MTPTRREALTTLAAALVGGSIPKTPTETEVPEPEPPVDRTLRILQAIYESKGPNVSLSLWRNGSRMRAIVYGIFRKPYYRHRDCQSVKAALHWIIEQILEQDPNSTFAKRWNAGEFETDIATREPSDPDVCQICGTRDPVSTVIHQGACVPCQSHCFGLLDVTPNRVEEARRHLGLAKGEFGLYRTLGPRPQTKANDDAV